MLSRTYPFLILLLFTSCALFKSQNIQDKKVEELVSYLQGIGEGKGRLGINQQQYLFSFDAVLKDNSDWILAANIPLHGEEVLMLKDLKQEEAPVVEGDGLELRIEQGISEYLKSKKQSPEMARTFLLELRRIMRLVLHKKLGLEVACSQTECRIGDAIYRVEASNKQLSLKKSLSEEYEIEFAAMNLTDSIFQRSNVFLHSKNKKSPTPILLSLELFWK
ncbi:MAG: hypothetical protein H0V66_05900 [Bdellovibrionales bacterium]|nr:hypothetical protein [Bdellovibrionales bacterium]